MSQNYLYSINYVKKVIERLLMVIGNILWGVGTMNYFNLQSCLQVYVIKC